MNSAQNKMRTNGMFLRSFDSKRYQELQAQKQKILEKQKELMKIKERKDKKEAKRKKKLNEYAEEALSFAAIPENETEALSAVDTTKELENTENEEKDLKVKTSKPRSPESKSVTSEAQESTADEEDAELTGNIDAVDAASATNVENEVVVESKVEDPTITDNVKVLKEEPKTAKIIDLQKKSNDTIKAESDSDKISDTVSKPLNEPSGKVAKEYAIIAKLNKEAILRETEHVVQKSETLFAAINGNVTKEESKKVSKSSSGNDEDIKESPMKTSTDAYAVVDLNVTMSLLKDINDELKDKKNADKALKVVGNSESVSAKVLNLKDDVRAIYLENKENFNLRNQNYMSRSAGYHGDIDTSTSSIEPDIDPAVDQFLAAKFSCNGKERLIITEEQLSSLQYVGSSSSG